jgi:hypothetical protein
MPSLGGVLTALLVPPHAQEARHPSMGRGYCSLLGQWPYPCDPKDLQCKIMEIHRPKL